MTCKVSILIPTYNREKYIRDAVVSGLNQTFKDIEIIVVDNHSTDNTWSILQSLADSDQRVKIFQNENKVGPVRNWKCCIDQATGKYGKIIWSDDLIAPNYLEKTVGFLEDNEKIGFVYTGTEIFSDKTPQKADSYFIGSTGIYDCEQYINGVIFNGNYPVSPGCALFRLSDLKKNLLVDIPNKIGSHFPTHAIGNDLLIFLLTAHQYSKFAFVNEKLSYFRAHDGSISIQSENGKLPLHYDIVKAYFVENFREDLIPKMNTQIQLDLMNYSCAQEYNMTSVSDFYLNNQNFDISWSWATRSIIRKKIDKLIQEFKDRFNDEWALLKPIC